ncbi:hypothetical protein PhaeoP66_03208 [Phaeobacter inhibens]|uniref:Uncharacterized protein n=1 Tax=Phaeobacter inhibens TaxID=221822 RepID=A0ABN5GQT7_9RHOB|nr:hypothetical protein [Phaeobacter inhibens]AUQ95950.1 hypothetical protein PhaeoP66_03208 [Phaeobacter inhibens]
MARNETLEAILTDFRLDAGLSSSSSHNIQDQDRQIHIIQREQTRLWEETDWPHLRVERFIPLQDGQRFYDLSSVQNEAGVVVGDLAIDRLETVEVKDGGIWRPLSNGITRHHYIAHDSALDQRASPAEAWRIYEDEQIEIWPVPDVDAGDEQEGLLRFVGIRQLRPFVEMSDRADLDAQLLSLYAAGRYLVAQKSAEAELVLSEARKLFGRLTANLKKSPGFQMFGIGESRPFRRFEQRYTAPTEPE